MIEVGTEPPKELTEEDNIRDGYRQWFKVQWLRIITKQINATKKNNGFSFSSHRDYAKMLLSDPAKVWAEHNNLPDNEMEKRLQSVINLNVNEKRRFELSDADKMADLLMDRIGGNHATT